jgi:hypothetical protein
MMAQRRKTLLTLFTIGCVVGAAVAIFVGYEFFRTRQSIFVIFSAYVIILTGIVIFFGFRLIGVNPSNGAD